MTKLWFRRKLYGWGWTPCSWEGWAVIAVYIALLVYILRDVDSYSRSGGDVFIEVLVPAVVLTVVLLIVSYKTGEKPRWQWGNRLD